ncbi:MAG: SUMF1/EgtB/PvdO family nonheme iron enzyme [bacterium]
MDIRGHIRNEIKSNLSKIPAGCFMMGSELSKDEMPIYEIYLDPFFIMRYLVTNRQYAAFLNENNVVNNFEGSYKFINAFNRHTRIKFNGSTYIVDSGYENHPVISVNWHGADEFAKWLNCRLPTEAEWEKAARGGIDEKLYWWGNTPPKPYSGNYGEIIGDTTPIGQFSANNFGLYDIEGNVSEWCFDWYDKDYYKKSPMNNPKGPEAGSEKVFRGGNWSYSSNMARVAKRNKFWFMIGKTKLGFRVVFDN